MKHTTIAILQLFSLAAASSTVGISFDAGAPTTPNPRLYEKCLGSGHATLTLREDWRAQVATAREELGVGMPVIKISRCLQRTHWIIITASCNSMAGCASTASSTTT